MLGLERDVNGDERGTIDGWMRMMTLWTITHNAYTHLHARTADVSISTTWSDQTTTSFETVCAPCTSRLCASTSTSLRCDCTMTQPRTLILGHRGASAHLPENTLASYEAAIREGADGIESDIHLSRDRVSHGCSSTGDLPR
jgi:hypothetical protein